MRIKDPLLLKTFQGQPCEICGRLGVGHHIKTRGSGGDDVVNNLVTLCQYHHREIHDLGTFTFSQKYSDFSKILSDKGWCFEHKKLRRK